MAYISMSPRETPVSSANGSAAAESMRLEDLSARVQLSQQTLVRWVDRHLIDASLAWELDGNNQEVRVIELTPETLEHLASFAADYREDVVTYTQARRILKMIDRRQVKKMIRAHDIECVEVEGEKRVVVGSIEDYLMRMEEPEEAQG